MRSQLTRRVMISLCTPLALAACLILGEPAASAQPVQEYLARFEGPRVEESELVARLEGAFQNCGYLAISVGVLPGEDVRLLPIQVSEYGPLDLPLGRGPQRAWSCLVYNESRWSAVTDLLLQHADELIECAGGIRLTSKGFTVRVVTLLYALAREQALDLGGLRCVLSQRAQRYFVLSRASDYAASRHILIIEEPHYDVHAQYALYQGLDVFFTDNPELLGQDRTVFLAEGYPAGEPLSVEPLVQAEPAPTDALIRDVLATYLIPGYVAYEWKHQHRLGILGVEDARLYKISARLWTDLQQNGEDAARAGAMTWLTSVAARNASIARTLVAELERHPSPILFVGGRHLEELAESTRARVLGHQGAGPVLDVAELASLKASDTHGLVELLRAHGIGFYFLTPRSSPFPDEAGQAESARRYAELFRAQLEGDIGRYLETVTRGGSGVTVSPSPQAAAQVVLAKAGKTQDGKKDGKDERGKRGDHAAEGKSGKGGGGGGDNGDDDSGLKGMLRALLKTLAKKIKEAGRGLSDLWKDLHDRPQDWEKIAEKPDPKHPEQSSRELWGNKRTGELLGVHQHSGETRGEHPHLFPPEEFFDIFP